MDTDQQTTSKRNRRYRPGPAVFVTAAFIGPGTVLTASRAGALYGYGLVWAVVFSCVTAIILQEMSARLGIVSGGGLASAIRSGFSRPALRYLAIGLILSAILFGNSAYQTGNIVGAAQGLEILTSTDASFWSIAIAMTAGGLILLGRVDVFQWLLTGLVGIMGLIFVLSAILCGPSLTSILSGLKPAIPEGGQWFVIGLIGTTVVPYNLFLHASAAAERWGADGDKARSITSSLFDTILSVTIGGIITLALLITAAVTFSDVQLAGVKEIAEQLRPGLGVWAEQIFAIGLFAAGLTSSITAPIAAGYATAGCLGWSPKISDNRLKAVAMLVIGTGLFFALQFGKSPSETIVIAQIANGFLLPIIAIFLLWTMNRAALMGTYKNRTVSNFFGWAVVLVTVVIAISNLGKAWSTLSTLLGSGG